MNFNRGLFQLIAGLLLVVHITTSLDYVPVTTSITETASTELLYQTINITYNDINFDTAQKATFHQIAQNSCSRISSALNLLAESCTKNEVGLKIQIESLLQYKSNLLNIVLNDIIQQKCNWMKCA